MKRSCVMTDHDIIEDYAARLRETATDDETIQEFRERHSHRFRELCMLHLSILIDIPWNYFEERRQEHTPRSAIKRLLAGSKVTPQCVTTEELANHLSRNIISLINRLDTDEVCSTEGIFRKAGQVLRRRHVQDALIDPNFDAEKFPWMDYTQHDLASALKSVVSALPNPLLTDRLLTLFHQVAGLRPVRTDGRSLCFGMDYTSHMHTDPLHGNSVNDRLLECKQLKALRLLIQLIPKRNALVLERLLRLLTRTLKLQKKNLMNCSSLGTVFGPVLFPIIPNAELNCVPKMCKLNLGELQNQYKQSARLCAVLIDAGADIFRIPQSLAEDVRINRQNMFSGVPPSLSIHTPPATYEPNGILARISRITSPATSHESTLGNECSPPLVTGIRFVTPTLPRSSNSVTNKSNHFSSPKQPTLDNGFHSPNLLVRKTAENADVSTQGKDVTTKFAKSPLNSICASVRFPSRSRNSCFTTEQTGLLRRRGSFSAARVQEADCYTTKQNPIVNPPKYDSSKTPIVKRSKKRRYTEIKFPCNSSPKEHKKNLFSPCPPMKFFQLKRILLEKHVVPNGELSNQLLETQVI